MGAQTSTQRQLRRATAGARHAATESRPMADLSELSAYLADRRRVLSECEQRLESLQQRFETFNAEVQAARERELDQLVALTTSHPESLPEGYRAAIARARPEVELELGKAISALQTRQRELTDAAEALRQESARDAAELRNRNLSLDEEEEQLKDRSAGLMHRINEHNDHIATLGKSFGFVANFFRMRRLARDKGALEAEQKDVLARIESLRRAWREADHEHAERESDRRRRWVALETDAAAVAAKLETLAVRRGAMIARSTVERALVDREQSPPLAAADDPPCPRCGMANPPTNHFCHICAQRLGEDRPDLEGSLAEFAELDLHAHRFGEGMKACQELIGLVRGMRSGVEALDGSVQEMLASKHKHRLATLDLTVPQWSRDFGARFDDLRELAQREMRLHPLELAHRVGEQIDIAFTETNITAYFELIGREMSRAADAQWGS
jgi:predicted  nucleic acid-binding Zn-ribbon protein